MGKVSVHLPGTSKICRSLNQHGCRTERLKSHDKVSEVKLCFKVQLNINIRLAILRLPPALLVVWAEAGDDILDTVTDGVVHRIVWSARITLETFLLLL